MKRLDPSSDKRYNKIKVRHQRKDLDQRRLRATEFSQKQVQESLPAQKGRPGHKNASSFTRAVREFGERRHNFDTKAYSEVMKKPKTVTKGRLSLQKAGLFMRGKVSSVARRDSPLTEINQARLDDDLHRIIRLANADEDQEARSRARNCQPDTKKSNMTHRNSFAGSRSSPISDAMSDYNNSQREDDPPTPTFEETGRKERGKRPKADEEKDLWADLSIADCFSPKFTSTCRKPRLPKRPPCEASVRDIATKKHLDNVCPTDSDAESIRSCRSNGSAAVGCGTRARGVVAKKPMNVRPADSDVESVRSNCSVALRCGSKTIEVGSYKQFANPVKEFLREFHEEEYWNKPELSVLETAKSKLQTLFNKFGRVALEKDARTSPVESPETVLQVISVTPENRSSVVDVEIDAGKPFGNRTNHNRTSVIQRNIPVVAARPKYCSSHSLAPSVLQNQKLNGAVMHKNGNFAERDFPPAVQRNISVATAASQCGSTQSVAPPVPQNHKTNGVAAQQDGNFAERNFPSALQRHGDRQHERMETNSKGEYSKQRATDDSFRRSEVNRFYDDRNLQQTEVNGAHQMLPVYPSYHSSSSDRNANVYNNAPATPSVDDHDEFFFSPYVPLDPVITNPLEYLEQALGESHTREKRDRPHPGYGAVERRDPRITEPLQYPERVSGDRERGDQLHPEYGIVKRRDASIAEPLQYPEGVSSNREREDRPHPGYDLVERRDVWIREPLQYPEELPGDRKRGDRPHPGYSVVERRDAMITNPLQRMEDAFGDDRNWKEDVRYRPGYDAVKRRDSRGIPGYGSGYKKDTTGDSPYIVYERSPGWNNLRDLHPASSQGRDDRRPQSLYRAVANNNRLGLHVVDRDVRQQMPSKHYYDAHQSGLWRDRSSPSQQYTSVADLDRESRSRRSSGAKRRSDSGFSSWAEEDKSENHFCKKVVETPACVFQPRYMS